MNMPNLASCHHCMRRSRSASPPGAAARAAPAPSSPKQSRRDNCMFPPDWNRLYYPFAGLNMLGPPRVRRLTQRALRQGAVSDGNSQTVSTPAHAAHTQCARIVCQPLVSVSFPGSLVHEPNLTGPAEEALRAQRAKYPPSHALSSSHETHLETNVPDAAPPAAPAHCRAHTDARDLPPPRRLRGCAWRPYLLPDTRPRRTAVDCARRARRIARLLPSVPAAAGPPSQADLHRRAGVGKIGEAR